MIRLSDLARVHGRPAHDSAGVPVGTVDQLYMSDSSSEPRWVTLRAADGRELFAPLEGAEVQDDGLRLAWPADRVLASPSMTVDDHLDSAEETRLCEHYALDAEPANGRHAVDLPQAIGDDGAATMHLSGERLVPRTEEVTRQLRLRRYVVTETELVEVPVKRERLAIERVNEAGTPELVEEFTLREERVVSVRTETFAVEDVQIAKAVVEVEEQLTVEVSRERAEVDADAAGLVSDPDRPSV
jgi:stress response protein YsnF